MIFTDNKTVPLTSATITGIGKLYWGVVENSMNTRFTFTDILTVTEPAVQLAGQSIRNYSDEQLKQIAATLFAQNEAHKSLFSEDMKNGGKPVPEVIDLIKKEIARREDAAIDTEIEAAQRVVEANKTQEMRLAEAQKTLDAALAKKAARKA